MEQSEQKQVVVRDQTELSVDDLKGQVAKIQEIMKNVMQEGQHYGVIPGTDKPTLLQPGAEKLAFTFRLATEYKITKTEYPRDHREYEVICRLSNMATGALVGEGVGMCSTRETKYRYRMAKRICPKCNAEAIIKGKEEYGGGWLCFKKTGGCGAKFEDSDPAITDQTTGRIENPDIADTYNTALKIGKKRSFVDAVKSATAASDIYTQDIEDLNISKKDTDAQDISGQKKDPHQKAPVKEDLTEGKKAALDLADKMRHDGKIDGDMWALMSDDINKAASAPRLAVVNREIEKRFAKEYPKVRGDGEKDKDQGTLLEG